MEAHTDRPTVLLVEDNAELAAQLIAQLQGADYRCLHAETLGMARRLLEGRRFAVILLDVMLPDGSSLDLLREIRAAHHTPIIMITARDQGHDKIAALDWGADDYLVKPFWIEELMARIRAVERRYQKEPGAASTLELGDLHIDLATHTMRVAQHAIDLTPTQWRIIEIFCKRPNRPVRRGYLGEHILPGDAVSDDAVHAQISRLRKKLGDHGWRIETVWGIGYKFCTADQERAP